MRFLKTACARPSTPACRARASRDRTKTPASRCSRPPAPASSHGRSACPRNSKARLLVGLTAPPLSQHSSAPWQATASAMMRSTCMPSSRRSTCGQRPGPWQAEIAALRSRRSRRRPPLHINSKACAASCHSRALLQELTVVRQKAPSTSSDLRRADESKSSASLHCSANSQPTAVVKRLMTPGSSASEDISVSSCAASSQRAAPPHAPMALVYVMASGNILSLRISATSRSASAGRRPCFRAPSIALKLSAPAAATRCVRSSLKRPTACSHSVPRAKAEMAALYVAWSSMRRDRRARCSTSDAHLHCRRSSGAEMMALLNSPPALKRPLCISSSRPHTTHGCSARAQALAADV
mmetsp:Transcript_22361/g.70129  ORF Transcript_22361/g.70129 Transcript_22361/m.70129 type:complete len:354 (-) Transcript_22361:82-1143(-)